MHIHPTPDLGTRAHACQTCALPLNYIMAFLLFFEIRTLISLSKLLRLDLVTM